MANEIKTETGGPAFPTKRETLDPRTTGWSMEQGMTMRDYFAAKAMQGLLASNAGFDEQGIAHYAYLVADAMLAASK